MNDRISHVDTATKPTVVSATTDTEASVRHHEITVERLKEMLSYDAETGVFTWLQRPYRNSRRRPGDEAGTLKTIRGASYRYIGIDGHSYLAAQLAWLYGHGQWPVGRVATANGDTNDLRLANIVEMGTAPGEFDHDSGDGRVAYMRAHRIANPVYYQDLELRRSFGITLDDYNALLAAQNGVCAICEQPETLVRRGKRAALAVDHDHATNAVRGLLCSECNIGVGKFRDDPEMLRRAARYLERKAAPDNVVTLVKKETA